MSSLLRKILFKDESIKQFIDLNIYDKDILEEVFFVQENNRININNNHCIVCQDPFAIAVWNLPSEQMFSDTDVAEMLVCIGNKIKAKLTLAPYKTIEISNTSIYLYKIKKATNYQINNIYQYLLLRQFHKKNKNAQLTGNIYSALYSYPRKVIIVSYKDNAYYNIFPMDFQGYISESDLYLLGLRTTNITLDKIMASKKVVISDIGNVDTNIIYGLGQHHSNQPPEISTLPFTITSSEIYKFPVPDFCSSYREVEILDSYKTGSHMLLIGKVINTRIISDKTPSLYHLHLFEYLKSDYTKA